DSPPGREGGRSERPAGAASQAPKILFGSPVLVAAGAGACRPRAGRAWRCRPRPAGQVAGCQLPPREARAAQARAGQQGSGLRRLPAALQERPDSEEPTPGGGQGRQLLWLALEHIQDPMNLGPCCAPPISGVDRVVASRSNSCPLTPTVSKASAGAMEVFDVYGTDDLQGFLKAKSAEGWEVVGTVSRPEDVEDVPVISCSEFQWDKPIIVVIGIAISCAGCEGGVPPSKSVCINKKNYYIINDTQHPSCEHRALPNLLSSGALGPSLLGPVSELHKRRKKNGISRAHILS
uniref:Mitochondrial rRNA methyltransferase 1 n=1 Tax=Malurus cyaneus samueli TaxID=2593467 RepID=A0A8C5UCJ7_9PASS